MNKIDELTIKVDNAKSEAIDKEIRNKEKIDRVCDRLNTIEENLRITKDTCEKRKKSAEEQRNRMRLQKYSRARNRRGRRQRSKRKTRNLE